MGTGRLELIVGPMMSGKSSDLLQKLLIASELGLKILYINHVLDTRSSNVASTHHPFLIPKSHPNIDFISLSSLKGVRKEEYDVIGIDEAQFFDSYLIEFCKVHVETYKRRVIVAGLDADSNRDKFGHVLDLIPLSDKIKKKRAFCVDCGSRQEKALFSYKYHSGSSPTIDVGGKDKYKPLCRECYLQQS